MRAAGEGGRDLSKVTQLVNEPGNEPRLKSGSKDHALAPHPKVPVGG